MPLKATSDFFGRLTLDGQKAAIADRIVKEIVTRLAFLNNVGLDYLALDRSAETLSGGEAQRIRLASQIGSGLTGVMYVLDEPSIGLHQRDNDRLLDDAEAPARPRQQRHRRRARPGRDHAPPTTSSTWGRAPASTAGRCVAQGTPEDIRRAPHSLTGQYLAGHRQIPMPARRHTRRSGAQS